MIQAHEVRVGNLIYQNGKLEKVFNIINETINYENFSLDKNISGIPLSESILLKLGFEKISVFEFCLEQKVRYSGGIDFIIDNTGNIRIKQSNQDIYLKTEIKYIHQLENLYLSVMGTELDTSKIL